MKCAKEMASLVDCTEKEINAVVGSRSEGNCNSDLIRKFKGGGVYLEIAKSRIISLFYRIKVYSVVIRPLMLKVFAQFSRSRSE